ncbi:MAG TPA: serine/threonine-protein kinase [Gemmatimonadaceae bacterium]|nr:serine/threonine-protein kinase [Gemmatimonadaceae bacterium]
METLEHLTAVLGGRYHVERELGVGGMATVYLARDIKHDRHVAIKLLRPELSHSLGPERFLREIRIVAKLQHPHILGLIDSGEADGMLYYVMPYVPGESLRTRLAREGELPISEAVWILREIADALAHAHANQIIHRDIKPENVLFTSRHAQVADFGIARAVSEAAASGPITATGIVVGSPAYMAPEQASSDPMMDHRADIYAFGVLAYEVLTGMPPFTAPSAVQLVAAHMTRAPDPLGRHRPGIPESLEDVVLRCLAKRPADRFQKADEIVSRLDALLTGPLSEMIGTTQEHAVAPSKFRIAEGLARRLDRQAFDPRMVGDSMEYLDNHARSDTLVCFLPALGLDAGEYEEHLRVLPWRCVAVTPFSHEPMRHRRYTLSLTDHFTLLRHFLRHTTDRTGAKRVIFAGFSSGADAVMRFAAARPGGGARIDGVLSLGCNISLDTCFVTGMLARMSSRHPERLLADLRAVGETMTELDSWLTVHTYLVAMLRKFRSAVDPLRSLAREIVRPFEEGGDSPFITWYREASANVRGVRCVFEDNERHRNFVSDLLLSQSTTKRLGERYREDSIVIEPDAAHFDLERPEIVQKHLEALMTALDAQPAAAT